MAISSASTRVYDAPDPVLETDLELLAKVNTFQQSRFDAGAAAYQSEVDKWAMMSQIAKPELKAYANQKLNNLVNGINNMGGMNLGDINNVNSLKAMGYNIYGDQRIVDGVTTTQKMKALQTASAAKLNGKDAAKYDPTVAGYLMKGYNDWATDGNVDNTKYDGPIDLPMGNMNTINEKVQKYLKDLKPDSESMPSGDLQKSYGYFQVDGKWLKGNRIQEAIDATVDQNDALVFKAHGWSALDSNNDQQLKDKLGVVYDSTSTSIKDQINYLNAELNQTQDATKKIELRNLISQQKAALARNDTEKADWYNKPQLSKQEREGIQESLFKNAWKSNVSNSYGYNQQKTELKSNMPLIFHDRMQQQAYQWAKDYDLRVNQYELTKMKTLADIENDRIKNGLGFNFNDPYGVPMMQVANTSNSNQLANPQDFIDKINGTYFKMNTDYYQQMYNMMGANDSQGRFVMGADKQWKPRPEYKNQIEQEVGMLSTKLDNYSNLTDAERQAMNLPADAEELQSIFNARNQVNTYGAYRAMAEEKETQAINSGIADGSIPFDWRNVTVSIGSKYQQIPVSEALTLYKSGAFSDDTEITGFGATNARGDYDLTPTTMKDLKEQVDGMRKSAVKSYQKVGGKMFNSFEVPLPFDVIPKVNQEIIQKQLTTKLGGNYTDIKPLRGYVEMDFTTGEPRYMMEVQHGTGKKLTSDPIDVTEMIKASPGSGLGIYYPKSNISLIWGLNLSDNGSTPFDKSTNYKNAMRTTGSNYPYQISTIPNALNGTTGLKIKIALPIGNGTTEEVNVKNLKNGSTSFPSSVEAVQQYLNDWLSTPELKERFYKEHGLTLTK